MLKQTWIQEVSNLDLVFISRVVIWYSVFIVDYDGSHSYAGILGWTFKYYFSFSHRYIFCNNTGVIVGISRLSPNYLIAKLAEIYVEVFRNIPLLLQIFFWYFAALRALPLPTEAINFFDLSFLTIKGFFIPRLIWTNFPIIIYSFVAAIVAIVFIYIHAKRKQEATGENCLYLYFDRSNNTRSNCIFLGGVSVFGGSLYCTTVKNNFEF